MLAPELNYFILSNSLYNERRRFASILNICALYIGSYYNTENYSNAVYSAISP